MEITNGQPWQNSVFWRGAECLCQEAEFSARKLPRTSIAPTGTGCTALLSYTRRLLNGQKREMVFWLIQSFPSCLGRKYLEVF
jgi:hypothetical protein